MATLIWFSGGELGNLTSEFTGAIGAGDVACDFSTTQKLTGLYSLRTGNNSSFNHGWKSAYINISNISQLSVGFHIRHTATLCSDANGMWIFNMTDSGGTILVGILSQATTPGYKFIVNNVQIGSTLSFSTTQWYHIGIDIKKDASAGWVYFYVDGTLVASIDGNTGAAQVTTIRFGTYPSRFGVTWATNAEYLYYDDMQIYDLSGNTSPEPVIDNRFYLETLISDGTYTEFSTYTGSSHYSLIDELPPVETDYVYSTNPGNRDSYNLSSYVGTAGSTVNYVIPIAITRKESAADILLGVGTLMSGTSAINSYQTMPTSYGLGIFEVQDTNPLGNPWTEDDVNNIQFIMMTSGTFI